MATAELTTKQVAERLGVAAVTVRQWCSEGRFKGARLADSPRGSYWAVPESALVNFQKPTIGRPAKPKANGAAKKPAAKKGGKR